MSYSPQSTGFQMHIKDKDDDGRITQLSIGAFISFAGLIIVLITQLKLYEFNIITLLLILMLLILISGFYGKPIYKILRVYFKKRRRNKLAKYRFEDFKRLAVRFSDFIEDRPSNIQMVMKDIKNTASFSQITVVQSLIIQWLYQYYTKHLDQFNGTEDSLIILIREFESILYTYDEVYIKEPIKIVKNIGSDKVPRNYIDSYNKAQKKYEAFIMDYNAFAKIANEDFKEKEETLRLFRDSFETPENL